VLRDTNGPVPLKQGDVLLIPLHPLLVVRYHLVASKKEKSQLMHGHLLQRQDLTV